MATTFQRQPTAQQLVSELMLAMSMTVPTSIAGATDKRTKQFWQLATDAGQQLAGLPVEWAWMSAEMHITTVPGTAVYDLPTDFMGFIQDASWNRTSRLPVIGALTEQEWQMLKARLSAGTTFTVLFRVANNQIEFYDTPTSVQEIYLPYRSRGWATGLTRSTPVARSDNLQVDTDVVLFDPQLFKAKLKLMWYMAKKFPFAPEKKDFERLLAQAVGADSPGRTLTLGRGSDYPYLGILNLPDTGYGS